MHKTNQTCSFIIQSAFLFSSVHGVVLPLIQVTTHQLWKQVYNTLGGNPRSTSAATCTRRHYEKSVQITIITLSLVVFNAPPLLLLLLLN